MIAVRIPAEIRKYKERPVFGLTGRQLLFSFITVLICFPLYWFGRKVIPEDIIAWLIIFLAVPLLALGFVEINGMPMEKFFIAWLKFEVLYPRNRVFRSHNIIREWQNEGYKQEIPKSKKERKRLMKEKKEAALERTFLLAEAEADGRAKYTSDPNAEKAATYNVDEQELLTVRKKSSGGNGGKSGKNKGNKKKDKKKSGLQVKAEAIEQKRIENPEYIPTKQEYKTLTQWYKKKEKLRIKEIEKGKKELEKKANKMEKRRKAKMSIPRSTQQSIPYVADYDEGLFEVTPNKFSKMYLVKDINYRTGKQEEQVNIFCRLGEFFNYFSDEMRFAIIIDNRVVSKAEKERKVFKRLVGDRYDRHRKEYNNVLRRNIIAGKNDIQVEKYITVTIDADTPIEALLRFHKIDAEVIQNLRRIGSNGEVISTDKRLEYYHDKYRKGREGMFQINYDFIKTQGISSKDYIAPSFIHFDRNHFQIEDEYYRILFINNLPASLQDEFLFDICDNDFPVTTTLSIAPVAQEKAMKTVKNQLAAVEADKISAERKAIKGGYDPSSIRHDIKDSLAQYEQMHDDLLNNNQKMFYVSITMMVHGSSMDELEENCKILTNKASKYTTQLQTLTIQQEEGYKMTLPFGYSSKETYVDRTLTTESTAIFMPFSNQELFQTGGFYYGLNQISQNLIVVDRTKMQTPSGFVLGSSGSGKSFATKREILNVLLDDAETGVIIIDPENEYANFCRAFGGTVLKISADSSNYINPLDMPEDYGLDEDDGEDTPIEIKKDKALKKKSDFIMSIVERMLSSGGDADKSAISPQHRTIIDRAVRETYKEYLAHDFDIQYLPTLMDFQEKLDVEGQKSEEGRVVATTVEYYTRGSMDVFSHYTNIDISNRLVVFNIRGLTGHLRQIALVIMFDFVWNRMIENKNKGIYTYCYCDEIHIMFASYYAAEYLKQLYKRGRKYGLVITGITQNVEELLRSEQAVSMISNSKFIMMLNQSSEDLKKLAEMLNISETQRSYVTGAVEGSGLLYVENVIVPFIDRFPQESYLYKLMSTKFGEDMSQSEIDKIIKEIMEDSQVDETAS